MSRYILTGERVNKETLRVERVRIERKTREEAWTARWSMMRAGFKTRLTEFRLLGEVANGPR